MSVRNLEFLFRPKSVAVVGASDVPGSYGAVVLRNLMGGGLAGPILPVTVKQRSLFGLMAHAHIEKLPFAPELAVLCTAAQTVPEVIEQLAARGTRAAILACPLPPQAKDARGKPLREAILAAARPHLMRLLGPGSAGLVVPATGLNASFAHAPVAAGRVAFVSQSVSVTAAVLDWARSRGIGFSCLMHVGESCDVDVADVLDYLASDSATAAILLHLETVGLGRKFMSAARAASRNKPLIAIRPGRVGSAARYGRFPAAALLEADDVYAAAMRRAGILRVFTSEGLFEAVEAVVRARSIRGARLGILANGAGFGRVAADALQLNGGTVPELPPDTMAQLQKQIHHIFGTNPLELAPDASAADYGTACRILLACDAVDAVLAIHAPTVFSAAADVAAELAQAAEGAARSLFTCWVGGDAVQEGRRVASARGLLSYDAPEKAVEVFLGIEQYRRNRQLLMQAPPSVPEHFAPETAAARQLLAQVLHAGREILTDAETRTLLAAYGIPMSKTHSPGGGVAPGGEPPPGASDGSRRGALEMTVAVVSDPVFGPVVMAGCGTNTGRGVRNIGVGLPPLNMLLAGDLIAHTRIPQALAMTDLDATAARDALCRTLVQVSQLFADLDEVEELEIDPLRVDAGGVTALNAQVRVLPHRRHQGWRRFAVRPYPRELEARIEWAGESVLLRPIRPEDEAMHGAFLESLSTEDMRNRFFHTLRRLPRSELARYTQIDYDREMALIAVGRGEDGAERTLGVVRAVAEPDNRSAEFAIVVRSDLKGKGLGRLLMEHMIAYLRDRGTAEIRGETMLDNERMKSLARELGFGVTARLEEGIAELRLPLHPPPGTPESVPSHSG